MVLRFKRNAEIVFSFYKILILLSLLSVDVLIIISCFTDFLKVFISRLTRAIGISAHLAGGPRPVDHCMCLLFPELLRSLYWPRLANPHNVPLDDAVLIYVSKCFNCPLL